MLSTDSIKGQIFANVTVHDKLDACFFQLTDATHHDVFFELEARNTVGQQTASAVITVINRDLNTLATKNIRRSEASRSSADDANGFTTLCRRNDRLHPTLFPRGVSDVLLNRTNGDSAVTRLFNNAVTFAQTVLRANAATDFWESVCRLADLICFLQTARGSHAEPIRDVVVQRAMRLTIRHTTLATTARLLFCFRSSELGINFVEVLTTNFRATLFGHVTANRHEL